MNSHTFRKILRVYSHSFLLLFQEYSCHDHQFSIMFVLAVIKIQIYTNENKTCNLVLKIMINHFLENGNMAIEKGFKIFPFMDLIAM